MATATANTDALLSEHTPVLVIRSIFNKYDTDHNNVLDPLELRKLFYDLGFLLNPTELAHVVEAVDKNHNHVIEFDELAAWWHRADKYKAIPADVLRARKQAATYFAKYDTNQNGVLELAEFRKVWADLLAASAVSETVEEAIHKLDKNNDGMIQFTEFVELTKNRFQL
ncbi:hypothetical protein Pelo_12594 [Pelomyxa schiedti]|nr:hypothetical protein Pelo_12594 [Pelomyxa schiedti]